MAMERRAIPRNKVENMTGVLIYQNESFKVRVKNISPKGCQVEAESSFAGDLLQSVELQLSFREKPYKLYGRIEWTKDAHLAGISFQSPNITAQIVLSELMDEVLFVLNTEMDAAPEAAVVPVPEPIPVSVAEEAFSFSAVSRPAVAALQKPSIADRLSVEFVRVVHQGAPRASSTSEGEWTAEIQFIDRAVRKSTVVLDLSLRGCSLQSSEDFGDECDSRAQLVFLIAGLRFVLSGEPTALEDKKTLGVRFVDMNERRREFMNKLVMDLRDSA